MILAGLLTSRFDLPTIYTAVEYAKCDTILCYTETVNIKMCTNVQTDHLKRWKVSSKA